MDITSFGQVEIYNDLFPLSFTHSVYSPTECIREKYSYCVMYEKRRIPIMIGSRFHTHKNDNPLNLYGYYIIDGICKSVSSMYVYDKMLYTHDRAYISSGRVSIISMGKYDIYKYGKKSVWYLPMNYSDIFEYSSDKVVNHLNIVANHTNNRSENIKESDAFILAYMFESYLGDNEEYTPIKRLITSGELIHDSFILKADIIKYFRTHTWTVKNIQNVNSVSEDMKHYSIVGDVESIRRVTYPTVREITRMEDRYVKDCDKNIFCPVQTSDGALCGTIMYLCIGTKVTLQSTYKVEHTSMDSLFLFVNGKYVSMCTNVTTFDNSTIYRYSNYIHVLTNYGRILKGDSMVSYTVDFIPFRTHNPAIRSMFTSSMIKQAISMDSRVRDGFFDDTKYLVNGEQPLVGKHFPYPCGWNVTVSIMPYFGYNVEDAIVVSEKLAKELYVNEKINIYNTILETNYDKIIETKISIGDYIEKGDILFIAYHPKEIVTIETIRSSSKGKVIDIYSSQYCYSVKVVNRKELEVGDKMSSRHGQKGVISKIVPNEDMPKYYDESSDTWNNIDLIINPHTFPTRKTMGQLLEMGNKTYKIKIKDKPIKNPIIVGKCYYMALRHQVADKLQFRNIGKIDDITHQAISGKSRGGGLRFGHMERDIMLAMGAHKELMYLWDIDRVKISCCEICGIIDQPKYIPCTHNRIIKDSHQYLLICLALLRANGHNIKYYPYSEEYEIVDYDIKSNTEEVKNINDLHFGYTYILKLKHYNSNNIIIPVIPSILRTNHLENLYKRMFNKSRHDDILKEIRKLLTSKKSGMYHDLVEGHRINHCVRSVIVPAPHLSPDTVELPLGCDIGKKYGLLNRQPSLGEGSIMSVKLVIGKNKTIGIHPSLCKSFNADFDGDEMCIYGLDELSNKLPIYENYTQDYLHTPNVNSFTYTGLTSTKEGIKYMVEKNIKGTNIDFKHIYDKIGDVIVNGKIIGHINNNYFNGLTQDEWYIQSKAGREGASSIGINTPFIGDLNSYVNRTLI